MPVHLLNFVVERWNGRKRLTVVPRSVVRMVRPHHARQPVEMVCVRPERFALRQHAPMKAPAVFAKTIAVRSVGTGNVNGVSRWKIVRTTVKASFANPIAQTNSVEPMDVVGRAAPAGRDWNARMAYALRCRASPIAKERPAEVMVVEVLVGNAMESCFAQAMATVNVKMNPYFVVPSAA